MLEAFRCSGTFFDQRCVLLGHAVELADFGVDMSDTGTLLDSRRRDLANDVGDPAHRGHDLFHGRPGFLHQAATRLDPLHTVGDQVLDLTRRFGTALSEASDLGGHHRKAASLLAGSRRFDRRIECQDIGLKGDAIDHADDVGDLA